MELASDESSNIKSQRRSLRYNKNFDKVQSVLPQDDNGKSDFLDIVEKELEMQIPPLTPRRRTFKNSSSADFLTPRRSERKSVKPAQDYEDIVANKSMREKHSFESETGGSDEKSDMAAPKWTPAKVGRGSQRKKRKNRKTKGKQESVDDQKIVVEEELLVALENEEDENKENVSPQDLCKQRKFSKEHDKAKSIRRSDEMNSAEKKRQIYKNTVLMPIDLETLDGVENYADTVEKATDALLLPEKSQQRDIDFLSNITVGLHTTEHLKVDNKPTAANDKDTVQMPLVLKTVDGGENYANTVEETMDALLPEKTLETDTNSLSNITVGLHTTEHLKADNKPTAANDNNTVQMPLAFKTVDGGENNANTVEETMDALLPEKSLETDTNSLSNITVSLLTTEHLKAANEPTECYDYQQKESTFNSSDCIFITPEKISEKKNRISPNSKEDLLTISVADESPDCMMQSLIVSDEEESENQNKNIELIIPSAGKIRKVPSLTDFATPKLVAPKERAKPYRFPTPYKSQGHKNISFEFSKDVPDEDEHINLGNELQPMTPSSILKVTKLEPKEIILRSIRKKRSLSECIDRPQNKTVNRVKFHSPANQTAYIEDLDLLATISTTSQKLLWNKTDKSNPDTKYITTRRKRSLSLDETIMQMQMENKPGQASLTPKKLKGTPQKFQRTKIPNFALIHQRNFNKMENLTEHLQRKANRAKILSSSNSKVRTASAQKINSPTILNNTNIEKVTSAGTAGSRMLVKPKALKKIDLNDIPVKSAIIKTVKEDLNQQLTLTLPNSQLLFNKSLAVVRPLQLAKNQQNTVAKTSKKVLKSTKETKQSSNSNSKPPFNLATTYAKTNNTSLMVNTRQPSNQPEVEKFSTRRQRHMDMFKGRTGGRARKNQENACEIIQGVRSNRRFELQMQHRKNLGHHTE